LVVIPEKVSHETDLTSTQKVSVQGGNLPAIVLTVTFSAVRLFPAMWSAKSSAIANDAMRSGSCDIGREFERYGN
jgi:hypothetical protein